MHVLARVRTSLRCALRGAMILLFLLLGCGISHAEPGRRVQRASHFPGHSPRGPSVVLRLQARHFLPGLIWVAKEGSLFENVVAASNWTVPSHLSLLTSLYPSVHGVTRYDTFASENRSPPLLRF